ncbi:MAG TPA: GspE/PulE family protein [Opitutales bacterium]|nr:GspE/PulE family protein [Opitutales bacterium]
MAKTFAELLREKHPMTADKDLGRLVKKHGENSIELVEAVIIAGMLSHTAASRLWSEIIGIAYIDPFNTVITPEAIGLIPAEIARKAQALPLYVLDGVLTVALPDPLDASMKKRLEGITGHKISPMFALPAEIHDAIEVHYSSDKDIEAIVKELEDTGEVVALQLSPAELEKLSESKSLIRIVDSLVYFALRERASDIHIEPQENDTRVRYRIDGRLREILRCPKILHRAIICRLKVMCDLNIAQNRFPQDGRFSLQLGTRRGDFRVSFIPTVEGEKCVIRVLASTAKKDFMTLDKMLISQSILTPFKRIIQSPNGIVFVTGPTGSGKTTTLYAALAEVNSVDINVSTIEDPVELKLPGLAQSQVNAHIDLKFGLLLRALMRQDPDVILVGEIRDGETAKIAAEAALTGHLVFATMHTNNAPQAFTRLMEIGVEPHVVAPSVLAVVSQRLAARICERCKESYLASPELLEKYFTDIEGQNISFYMGKGCEVCRRTGYKGRIGFHEMVVATEEIRDIVSNGGNIEALTAAAKRSGYRPLRHDGLKKVLLGMTTIEEVEANTPFEWAS